MTLQANKTMQLKRLKVPFCQTGSHNYVTGSVTTSSTAYDRKFLFYHKHCNTWSSFTDKSNILASNVPGNLVLFYLFNFDDIFS